jgi:hypothetical protein
MSGNRVPGAVGQGDAALLSGFQVAWINGTRQTRQRFGSGSQSEFGGSGRLSAVATGIEHWIEPLWVSVL